MELKYPENIKEIINGIYYRFSLKFGLNYRSQPVFFSFIPLFFLIAPQKMHFALTHLQTFHFFHCRDNMIKINPFSMAFNKTYCLFHFQTVICFFFHIFSYGQ